MDKDRVTGIEGFDIPNQTECELLEDSNIFYFNFKSHPKQILRKNGEDEELDMERFFDFGENENLEMAPLSSLFNYSNEESLDDNGKPGEPTATATISIQGIINMEEDYVKIQRVVYDYKTNVGKLFSEEEYMWFEDWQNEGHTIEDSLDIISHLEEEWSVQWETKGIFGVKGE